ncbi:MAG: DUF4159 domain-containing protein [Elusimicrobiota bacterium]|nr:DUF4159 domain-containing protein [Elusimicrobiota bacterium]
MNNSLTETEMLVSKINNKKFFFIFIVNYLLLGAYCSLPYCSQRDRFVFTQLQYDGDWDPYPNVFHDVLSFLTLTTSIVTYHERRIVNFQDELQENLFSSPFVIMLNNGKFPGFSNTDREKFKRYITSGGVIFIEDSSGSRFSEFDKKIRREIEIIFPDKKLTKIPLEHALYRSFYLLRGISGRYIINNYLECIDIANRTAIIYSQNDIFGAWARDKFGNYFFECLPGGEKQRFEAQKLTINLIVFSLTGTYKTDKVHKPFIEEKLRR